MKKNKEREKGTTFAVAIVERAITIYQRAIEKSQINTPIVHIIFQLNNYKRQSGVTSTTTDFSSILTGGLKKNVVYLRKFFTKLHYI